MASTLTSGVSSLYRNILTTCASLPRAVREYYQLPGKDRQQVWDDMTGKEGKERIFIEGKEVLTSEEYEPTSLVEESLKNLEKELREMKSSQKTAHDMALKRSPDYVNSRNFRLKFLRAEKFDVVEAAVRITRHFEEKLKLFGEESLGREIRLSDLDGDDMDALTRSYLQVLPVLDDCNRKVLFYYKALSDCYKQRENILRAFWYVANAISQDEDVQKLGVVNVVYNIGGFPKHGMDYVKSRWLSRLFRAIPVRFNSFYVCLDEGAWVTVVKTFSVMIARVIRIRLRMILGTHSEVQVKLKGVGIPSEALPVNDKSELLVESHLIWIKTQKRAETVEKAEPPSLDVEYQVAYQKDPDLVGMAAPFQARDARGKAILSTDVPAISSQPGDKRRREDDDTYCHEKPVNSNDFPSRRGQRDHDAKGIYQHKESELCMGFFSKIEESPNFALNLPEQAHEAHKISDTNVKQQYKSSELCMGFFSKITPEEARKVHKMSDSMYNVEQIGMGFFSQLESEVSAAEDGARATTSFHARDDEVLKEKESSGQDQDEQDLVNLQAEQGKVSAGMCDIFNDDEQPEQFFFDTTEIKTTEVAIDNKNDHDDEEDRANDSLNLPRVTRTGTVPQQDNASNMPISEPTADALSSLLEQQQALLKIQTTLLKDLTAEQGEVSVGSYDVFDDDGQQQQCYFDTTEVEGGITTYVTDEEEEYLRC